MALTVAIPVGKTDQVAESVMVFWLPSLKVRNRAELLSFTFRNRKTRAE